MRLLYLYINDRGFFSPFEASFDASNEFSFDSEKCKLSFHRNQDLDLPPAFFQLNGEAKSVVSDISAVVGRNGSGKTSVARFLNEIRCNKPNEKLSFDYILVYETGEVGSATWHFQWFIEVDAAEHFKSKELELPEGNLPKEVGVVNHNRTGVAAVKDFDFIYYTPHLTIENPFGATSYAMRDLSPNALISSTGSGGSLGEFATTERRRILDLIGRLDKENYAPKLGLSCPKTVKIDLNRISAGSLMMWINQEDERIQKEVMGLNEKLLESGSAESSKLIEGELDVQRIFLNQLKQMRSLYERFEFKYSNPNRDFFASALVCYLLGVMRSVNFFTKNNFEPNAYYAQRLYDGLVAWVASMAGDRLTPDSYEAILEKMEKAEPDSRIPGTPASSPWQLNMRRAVTNTFRKISDLCAKHREEQPLESIELPVTDKTLLELVDQYGFSLVQTDYLYFTFKPPLSAGDMSYLSLYARIMQMMEAIDYARKERARFSKDELEELDKKNPLVPSGSVDILLFLDEIETTLHPSRQLQLTDCIMRFLSLFFADYRFHVVFATHSPLLLSDIPSPHVTLLNRNKDEGKCQVHRYDGNCKTFASNVFDLYRDSFFLSDGTVGAFAQGKVDKVLGKIYDKVSRKDREKVEDFDDNDRAVSRLIGDKAVGKYLQDWIESIGFLC